MFLVALALATATGGPCPVDGGRAQAVLNARGEQLAHRGDWAGAAACFAEAEAAIPPGERAPAALCNNRALALVRTGHADDARRVVDGCFAGADAKQRAAAWFNLGLAGDDAGPFIASLLTRDSRAARDAMCRAAKAAKRDEGIAVYRDVDAARADGWSVAPSNDGTHATRAGRIGALVVEPHVGVAIVDVGAENSANPNGDGDGNDCDAGAARFIAREDGSGVLLVPIRCSAEGNRGGSALLRTSIAIGPRWHVVAQVPAGASAWGDYVDAEYNRHALGCDVERTVSLQGDTLVLEQGTEVVDAVPPSFEYARGQVAFCAEHAPPAGAVSLRCLVEPP